MDAINLILFAVLFVLQVAILILLLRRRSGDAAVSYTHLQGIVR